MERELLPGPRQMEARPEFESHLANAESDIGQLRSLIQRAISTARKTGDEKEVAEAKEEFGGLAERLDVVRAMQNEWVTQARAAMEAFPDTERAAIAALAREQYRIQASLADIAQDTTEFSVDGLTQSDRVAQRTIVGLIAITAGTAAIGLISSMLILRRLVKAM